MFRVKGAGRRPNGEGLRAEGKQRGKVGGKDRERERDRETKRQRDYIGL